MGSLIGFSIAFQAKIDYNPPSDFERAWDNTAYICEGRSTVKNTIIPKWWVFGIAAAALVLGARWAAADQVVSNLGDSQDLRGTIGQLAENSPTPYFFQAQEFTTGTQSDGLADIIVQVGEATSPITPSAELVADDGGMPGGTVLTSFAFPSVGSSFSDLTLTPDSTVTLSADTNYWLVLGATGSGSYYWGGTTTSQADLPADAASNDSGSTWVASTGSYLLEVDGTNPTPTAVPLPSSLSAVLALGTLALFGRCFVKIKSVVGA